MSQPPSASDARSIRCRLAERLRQLASGRLTNDEFEDTLPYGGGADAAAWELYHFAWMCYDDLYEHRLRGRHRLSPQQRQVFARCVLFLRSGLPYEWPKHAKWLWCRQRDKAESAPRTPWWVPDESATSVLPVFGRRWREYLSRREEARDRERRTVAVDDRIWPFRRMADLKAARSRPVYLAGVSAG